MSIESHFQKQQQKNQKQSPCSLNSRKKSDSTLEVTENVQQKLSKHNLHENKQQTEDFDEEMYNDLSSGVYQMSRKSQQDQSEPQEKQYFSMEVKIGDELPYKQAVKNSLVERKDKVQTVNLTYEQVNMNLEQYMQNVLSSKLQSQEVPNQNLPDQFTYPSLMEQSHIENSPHFKQQHSQQIQQEEIQIKSNSSQLKIQSNTKQKNSQANQFFQKKNLVQSENIFVPETEDLLDIKYQEKSKVTLNVKRREELIIPQQNLIDKFKLSKLVQGPRLKILGYQKQYFLKIETQVYQIEFSSPQKSYTFNRKFADFVLLQKLIKLKYPGYILYPFPQNSLQFFNKIKLSVGTQLQKTILIEKRLLELEKYLNYLLLHKQLGGSQIFLTFISESDEHFNRHITYLQNIFEKQQQKFESSKLKQNYKTIKNLVISGLQYFKSYISRNEKNIQNSALLAQLKRKCQALKVNYDQIITELQKNKLVTSNIQIKAEKLAEIYNCNIEMKPIQSSIDSVLRLSSKMASSKTAYQINKNWVEDKMLSKIYYFVNIFLQVQEQFQYRKSLLQKLDLLVQEQARLGLTIIQRVQIFDSRFIEDWNKLKTNFEQQYIEMIEQFSKQWQSHCLLMSKIWK